jgi:porphobilinogen synthase
MFARHRRLRKERWLRDLLAESTLNVSDLIQPVFVVDGENVEDEIPSLPGIYRYSIDRLVSKVGVLCDLGIPLVALFPKIDPSLKCELGLVSLAKHNIIYKAASEIKSKYGNKIGVMADVALDPYTSHGHDGILRDGYVVNDETVAALSKLACRLATAGVDVVAPSDMMDGRVLKIRQALDELDYINTIIASYAVKYNSAFYGPFREAVGSAVKGYLDKSSYQLDIRNVIEAELEVESDISEGADIIILKPGMPYLDVIKTVTSQVKKSVVAYQVSGEYALLKLGGEKKLFDYNRAMTESLTAFKRAGCKGIITYAAEEIASLLA